MAEYTPVGDILVLSICIVFGILIRVSFITQTRGFRIFCVMLGMVAIAACSNAVAHVLVNAHTAPYGVITALRVLHFSALFSNLFLFICYYMATLHIEPRRRRGYLIAGAVGLGGLVGYMAVCSMLGAGHFKNAVDPMQAYMQLFTAGYLYFLFIFVVMSWHYRGRIFRQVTMGVLASCGIAFVLLLMQSRHAQSSYTTASFLFPAAALLYLVHTNPYDIELGTVNAAAFDEYVKYNRRRGHELLIMSLLLSEFDNTEKKYPAEIRDQIRHFATAYFRGAVLFQVSNGRMLLTMKLRQNPDYEETMRKSLEAFSGAYAVYGLDHKIVILSTLDVSDDADQLNYIELIRYVESKMRLDTVRRVPHSDIEDYRTHCRIIDELADIAARSDPDDERVLVYCQPVLNLRTGRYDTAEALMRLKLDKLGILPPGRFIPLAEENRCVTALTMIILAKTCAEIRRLLDDGYELKRISVNFSMIDLREPDFSEHVSEIIKRSGIPSGKVAIELTESQNERDFMLVKERIGELHDSGIKFYLDDFGTGYSNFDRIMELPFDIIKFDRSLVLASAEDAEKRTMVSYLAQMFSEAHYSVLYEGVETDDDQRRCTEMCAKYLQGYKFSAPVPIDRLRDFFAKTAAV